MEESLKNIQKLAKMLDGHQMVTVAEFRSAVSDFINAFAQHRSAFKELSTKNEETINKTLLELQNEFEKMRNELDGGLTMTKGEMEKMHKKCLSEMKVMCDEMLKVMPLDGKDADEEKIVEDVLSKIKLPENKVFTAEEIRDNLESLEGEERLDASAIKNLPEATKTIVREMTGGNGTQPVKAGTNISITYDGNGAPVINSTASGSMSTHYAETPNEAIDGARVDFTVDNTITFIISVHMNGQFIHPADYTYTGTTITFGSPPDASYAGLPFTVVYF